MSTSESEKQSAARAALEEVSSGMTLGLGTGSTVRFFLEALASALDSGVLEDVRGVPTSIDTEEQCAALGIPTMALGDETELDLAVDGADEVSPDLDLVKGLGGALLREKIVVQAARRFVVIADSTKEVARLGEKAPIPVEVAAFGWQSHLPFFRSLGAIPEPREGGDDGDPAVSDNGNFLIDLRFPSGVPDPVGAERALRSRAGVVETGFFLGMAHRAFIGGADGVATRTGMGG